MTDTIKAKGPWWELAPYLRAREPFRTHGALRGEAAPPVFTGHLPTEYHESALHATYVVYSYSTPIAWYAHGTWVVPDTRYSVTTSAHQSRVRTALPHYEDA